ncbi:MAG: hypothetical protein ABJD82_09975 [Marinobacter sp.]
MLMYEGEKITPDNGLWPHELDPDPRLRPTCKRMSLLVVTMGRLASEKSWLVDYMLENDLHPMLVDRYKELSDQTAAVLEQMSKTGDRLMELRK